MILGHRIWIWRLGSNHYGVLILHVQHRSDGTGGKGVDGGGAGRRETLSRGGASPERLESGVPGVDSSQVLAVEHRHGMCNPLVALAWLKEVCGGAGSCGSESTLRSSPACGVQAVPVRELGCKRLVEPL